MRSLSAAISVSSGGRGNYDDRDEDHDKNETKTAGQSPTLVLSNICLGFITTVDTDEEKWLPLLVVRIVVVAPTLDHNNIGRVVAVLLADTLAAAALFLVT